MRSRSFKRLGVVVLGVQLSALSGVIGLRPAAADCVRVDFEIHHSDQPPTYPLGTREYCVVRTCWEHGHEQHAGDDLSNPQPGTPSGFWLQVWIPVP